MHRPVKRPIRPVVAPAAIVLIDGEPARKAARKQYEKARKDLASARSHLERYKSKDLPAFDRWYHRTFGPQLTALRAAAIRQRELAQLFDQIEEERFYTGASRVKAYLKVKHWRDHPEEMPPPDENDPFARANAPGGPDDSHESERDVGSAEFNVFDELYRSLFGKAPPKGFKPPPGFEPPPGFGQSRRHESKTPRNVAARVKELYRLLVRKLHPDVQEKLTAQKREWWHQVQEAYAANDVERLEVILGLCEMEDGTSGPQTSVSLLQRITAQLARTLHDLKRELRECRRDQAWNFSQRGVQPLFEADMREDLESELREILADAELMEADLKALEKSAAKAAARPTKMKVYIKPAAGPFANTKRAPFQETDDLFGGTDHF